MAKPPRCEFRSLLGREWYCGTTDGRADQPLAPRIESRAFLAFCYGAAALVEALAPPLTATTASGAESTLASRA
jgi:hypothetical protein